MRRAGWSDEEAEARGALLGCDLGAQLLDCPRPRARARRLVKASGTAGEVVTLWIPTHYRAERT
jgi:hypothetical protein